MLSRYRPVADSLGFLDWVHNLGGRSGVYVIRGKQSGETYYVGESHSGRLRETLKRHFWRWKDSWERPHHCYQRGRVEVAIALIAPSRALAYQNALIRRLNPRDNRNGWGPADDIPF